jgi:hypothetical protein
MREAPIAPVNLLLEETARTGWQTPVLAIAGAFLGYLLMFFTNPTYPFFRDGLRCLNRYPRVWLWLSGLGLTYMAFQLILNYEMGEISVSINDLIYWPPFKPLDWSTIASRAWLSSIELLAGLFNQAVVAYPISAIAALLFLINWHGYQGHFLSAARRRLGRWWLLIYAALLVCAVAAFCKPIFSLSIYWLNQYWGGIALLRAGAVIDWLSFQFEYLFGLMIQIFLILSTLVWIRGLHADSARIFAFALKRGVYAAKWAGIVLAASAVLIHLPLLISYLWINEQTDFTNAVVQYVEQTARPLLAIGLLLFCSVQIALILHNESLKEAIGDHAELVRRYWYRVLWFFAVAGLHLFAISYISEYLGSGFPKASVPGLLIGIGSVSAKGFFAGWFIASWVCLYRSSDTDRKEIRF